MDAGLEQKLKIWARHKDSPYFLTLQSLLGDRNLLSISSFNNIW